MTQITVKEAASALGITEQAVRCGLRRNKRGDVLLPIGYSYSTGKKRSTYVIFKELLEKFIGVER